MPSKRWIIVFCLVLAGCLCLGVGLWGHGRGQDMSSYADISSPAETEVPEEPTAEASSGGETPEAEPYESPIDFAGLWEINEDVYAWLDIPGLDISYPVLQHPTEEEYYLKRSIEGTYDQNGCIFSQAIYNTVDMTDPVTVLYGHNMRSGAMFGKLEETYSDSELFSLYHEIVIYLPEEELHYEVFAAVPYSDIHIMDSYNFDSELQFQGFLETIWSARGFGINYNEEIQVEYGDRILILSTCQSGGSTRYLVLAKLVIDE